MKVVSYREAKKILEQNGVSLTPRGPYQVLVNTYLGSANNLNEKDKLALREIFIKFSELQCGIALERSASWIVKGINLFVKNMLILAEILHRHKLPSKKEGDVQRFGTATESLKKIVEYYKKSNGIEALELELLIDSLVAPKQKHADALNQLQNDIIAIIDADESREGGKPMDARLILGLALLLVVAVGVTLGMSLGTDFLPHIEKIWESGNPEAIAKAGATAVPSIMMLAGLTQAPKVMDAFASVTRSSP